MNTKNNPVGLRMSGRSMESKIVSENEMNGVAHCKSNDIARDFIDEDPKKYKQAPRRYNSMLEYCLEVAKGLVQRQAFYIIDLADILRKVQLWKTCLPNVDIFYAVKANDDSNLLKFLTLLGLSFDCASEAEIRMTMAAGAAPSKIIFAHTIKTEEELQFASKVGVDLMTFDNEEELHKIHRLFPNARLVLRLSPADVNCEFDLSDKFGCNMEDAVQLLQLAQQLKMNVVGVSFHVGGLCADPRSYTSTIRNCRWVFDKANEMDIDLTILDIGGGFYGSSQRDGIFYEVSDAIKHALNEYFPDKGVRIIAEPGTFIAASAVRLVCTVIGKKTLKKGEAEEMKFYYINEGIYGSFFSGSLAYDIKLKPLLPSSEVDGRPTFPTRIFGQTCCSEDVIPFSGSFTDMKVGELVLWENMGAYFRGLASTFCGTLIPIQFTIFMANKRLSLDWIDNKNAIKKFLKATVVFIGCGEEDT